jgi:hypothetical protein
MKYLHQTLSSFFLINLLFLSGINATELQPAATYPSNFINSSANSINNVEDKCLLGDCESGYGVLLTSKNQKLIGQFQNHKLEGYGVVEYTSGNRYIGHFRSGLRDGEGELQYADGVIRGVWVNDRFIRTANIKSVGCQTGDCTDGVGFYVYENSIVYMGSFQGGKANGSGLCYFSDGDIYFGEWKNHAFDGEGTLLHGQNSSLYCGTWSKGNYIDKRQSDNNVLTADNTTILDKNSDLGESEIFAVVVGVAQYRHMPALKYTDDDAYGINTFLRSPEGGAVKKSNIKVLIDEAATKDRILDALNQFAEKADENDVFLFYFSGHGLPEALLPIDYEGEYSDGKLLHKDLVRIFKSSRAKSKVVIADACYSGNMLAYKGESYESSMENYYNEIQANEGGLVMFMSSKAEETSIENNGLRQGIFSHFLMRGLYGAANTDNDNLIRLDELFEYVQKNVAYYTNNYQTPLIYGDKSINLPIAVIRD